MIAASYGRRQAEVASYYRRQAESLLRICEGCSDNSFAEQLRLKAAEFHEAALELEFGVQRSPIEATATVH